MSMDSLYSTGPQNPSFILEISTPPGTKNASINISNNIAKYYLNKMSNEDYEIWIFLQSCH